MESRAAAELLGTRGGGRGPPRGAPVSSGGLGREGLAGCASGTASVIAWSQV